MRKRLISTLLLTVAAMTGCTKLSGTVYDAQTRRPMSGAVFTVGHPGGVGVFERKTTDAYGRFAFSIVPTDDSHVWVFDGGDPASATRLERNELGEGMKLYVRRSTPAQHEDREKGAPKTGF